MVVGEGSNDRKGAKAKRRTPKRIVCELTKRLGGEVSLESRPEQGSTFTVHLPQN
jgi:sensor histidine kinase regulating citrate/malate metabolism